MGIKNREPTPGEAESLARVPDLDDDMLDVVRCWSDLESCRSAEWLVAGDKVRRTIGPIPWTAIDRWAERNSLDARAFRLLAEVIGYLDTKFADRQSSENKL